MNSPERETKIRSELSSVANLLYRCVCGDESPVDLESTCTCKTCGRTIHPEAIKHAMSATVTLGDVHHATTLLLSDAVLEDQLIGKVLGHFQLESPLGRGGMGTVYRALDISLQRFVAVKVVRGSNAEEAVHQQHVTNMLQEAIAQARLNHPNVVTIYYVGREEGFPFLAMELVAGPTLQERLKLGSLPYADVVNVGIQVADALNHASQFGIVHADIKPSNLLIGNENQIKLSDFGLSRTADEREPGKVSGTPSHLAPELLSGSGFSIQSDMFALGVTLFELLFARLPYKLTGSTLQERLQSRQIDSLDFPDPWPKSIPLQIKDVFHRLLSPTPEGRYASYDDLIQDLRILTPVNTTIAGLAPRAAAFAVDQTMLVASMLPSVLGVIALVRIEGLEWYAWTIPILGIFAFAPPAIYLAAIRNGWRSLGSYLFQLRTVDSHGLPLRFDLRFTRELLRCMFTWLFPLSIYAGLFWSGVDRLIDAVLLAFFGVDIACFFLTSSRTTFHDWITGAHVVLDVNRAGLIPTLTNTGSISRK